MKAIFTLLPILLMLQACGETTQSEGLFSNLKDGQTHYERLAEVYESAGMPDASVFHKTRLLQGKTVDLDSQNYLEASQFLIYQVGDPVVGLEAYIADSLLPSSTEEGGKRYLRRRIEQNDLEPLHPDARIQAWVSYDREPGAEGTVFVRLIDLAGATYLISKAVCMEEDGCHWIGVSPGYQEVGYYTYNEL